MSKHLADVAEGDSVAEHGGRQGVPQPVRAHRRNPGPHACPPHGLTDSGGTQRSERCLHAHDQRPSRHPWASMGEVGDEGLADIYRQRETFDASALAVHDEFSRPPVDIVELQPGHLGSAQTETRQQDQHRIVTKA